MRRGRAGAGPVRGGIPAGLRDTPQVLLHTEIMREHLLVSQDRQLSGMIDFEPAMPGSGGG